jgi:thiamine-phosphate pyrophosphorylase
MRLIVISPPDVLPREPQLVARILEQLPVTLHLRKPGLAENQIAELLQHIPEALHPRIMVHDHAHLLSRFGLQGIHFTEKARLERLPEILRLHQRQPEICISSAFHRMADIPEHGGLYDYLFLSPVFDSISKAGYRAAFDRETLKAFLSQTAQTVIALGGIDEPRLLETAGLGFKGAAVLGAVWQAPDPVAAAKGLWARCRRIEQSAVPWGSD